MNTTLKDKNDGDNDHATHSSRDKESSSLRTSPVSILPQVPNLVEGIPPLLNPWVIPASRKASRTTNPIREIVDPILANVSPRDDGKEFLSLALGDPTACANPNLTMCPILPNELVLKLENTSGYVNACGAPTVREAIAKFHCDDESINAGNVIVASGCSGALELAMTAMLDEDSIVLVPSPGFPLYKVIAKSHGAKTIPYRLDPNTWQIDLEQLEEIIVETQQQHPGGNLRAMIVNNPSNPTGAVMTEWHLQQVVRICARHRIVIIADEVYGDMVFGDNDEKIAFHPLAKVAKSLGSLVPVITASGIGKQFLLPGWRVGWIVFHDNIYGTLQHVEDGAKQLAQVILGASHLAQSVVPVLLDPDNQNVREWKISIQKCLSLQAQFLYNQLCQAPGLEVSKAQGAMYIMVRIRIDEFDLVNDIEFTQQLLREENVFVLPGTCFDCPNAFRVVFCADIPSLHQASDRIIQFCQRHWRSH